MARVSTCLTFLSEIRVTSAKLAGTPAAKAAKHCLQRHILNSAAVVFGLATGLSPWLLVGCMFMKDLNDRGYA